MKDFFIDEESNFFLLLLFWIMCPFIITFGCLLLLIVGLVFCFILVSLWTFEQILCVGKVCYRTLKNNIY